MFIKGVGAISLKKSDLFLKNCVQIACIFKNLVRICLTMGSIFLISDYRFASMLSINLFLRVHAFNKRYFLRYFTFPSSFFFFFCQ